MWKGYFKSELDNSREENCFYLAASLHWYVFLYTRDSMLSMEELGPHKARTQILSRRNYLELRGSRKEREVSRKRKGVMGEASQWRHMKKYWPARSFWWQSG